MFNTSNLNASITQQQDPMVDGLISAAMRYENRTDSFATGKAATCYDLAGKLKRFGDFVSPKQAEFARKLVEWSKPRVNPQAVKPVVRLPKLFDVMQKHSHLYVEPLKLARKNQDTLVWVMYGDTCVGKLEGDAVLTLFYGRLKDDAVTVQKLLAEFEVDPLAAAQKYGKLSGRCCSCGRDLTDPASIEAGIGPRCKLKF
jgi:hypothetical protein